MTTRAASTAKFNAHVGSVKIASKLCDSNTAMSLLRQSANIVSPLLERRKMKIGALMEFYPSDQNLHGININRGQTIKVRLRSPSSADFYKLMEELSSEVERDMASGVDAAGHPRFAAFSGVARQLGCSTHKPARTLSEGEMRAARLSCLQKRMRLAALSAGSGQKLGRGSAAACIGMEREKNDGGMSKRLRVTPEERKSATITSAVAPTCSSTNGSIATPQPQPVASASVTDDKDISVMWRCDKCLFLNDDENLQCAQCQDFSMPRGADGKWAQMSEWVCPRCTLINTHSAVVCCVCGAPSNAPILL